MMMNNHYKFVNTNPLSLIEEDCVNRAINNALNVDYYKVRKQLLLIAELHECEALCVCCYEHLLDDFYKLKRVENVKGMPIWEFCELFRYGTFIIRVEGHLTCVINGVINDIWNCEEEIIDIVWEC